MKRTISIVTVLLTFFISSVFLRAYQSQISILRSYTNVVNDIIRDKDKQIEILTNIVNIHEMDYTLMSNALVEEKKTRDTASKKARFFSVTTIILFLTNCILFLVDK